MDQHYYPLRDNPNCPLDGSRSVAADEVLPILPRLAGSLSLPALAEAGVTLDALADTVVLELPDAEPVPWLLRPWYEGEREAR
jgi:hypothetical protein